MTLDRARLFTSVRSTVFAGKFKQPQVDGINLILDAWEASGFADLRWLAYMLGTTYHETAHTMQPVKENGGDAYYRRMYDISGDHPSRARGLGNIAVGDGARYCGRGYVQLTGKTNYTKMSRLLGVDLVANPDMAMQPAIAAKIMFAGMTAKYRNNTFTGMNLQQYFNDEEEDWVNARQIINGMDNASMIAETAQSFHAGLAPVGVIEVRDMFVDVDGAVLPKPPPPVDLLPAAPPMAPPPLPPAERWWRRFLPW